MNDKEREHLTAVLAEIVPQCELVNAEPLSPEVWAALWWRDLVLRKALPDREFAIVHEEAKALAAVPRLLQEASQRIARMTAIHQDAIATLSHVVDVHKAQLSELTKERDALSADYANLVADYSREVGELRERERTAHDHGYGRGGQPDLWPTSDDSWDVYQQSHQKDGSK